LGTWLQCDEKGAVEGYRGYVNPEENPTFDNKISIGVYYEITCNIFIISRMMGLFFS